MLPGMVAAVQRLALFDLDNTLVNLDEAFHVWAGKFAEEHDLDREAVDWLIALDRAGYPHREVFFTKVRDRFTLIRAHGRGSPAAGPLPRRVGRRQTGRPG